LIANWPRRVGLSREIGPAERLLAAHLSPRPDRRECVLSAGSGPLPELIRASAPDRNQSFFDLLGFDAESGYSALPLVARETAVYRRSWQTVPQSLLARADEVIE